MSLPASYASAETRPWLRVGFLLFAVGWGANHFASLLQVYRAELRLDAAAPAVLFGMYALGLAPGLVLGGPLSDRFGRRAVVLPCAIVALWASVGLGALGDRFVTLLFGRFAYGLGAGGVMSAGAVWLIELSHDAALGTGARRATIALSSGFGLGPFVTGLLAQYAPAPTALPYLVHVTIGATALIAVRSAHDTGADLELAGTDAAELQGPPTPRKLVRIELDRASWARFLRGVAPMAPFVFGFPAIAFAALPSMLGGALGRAPLVYTGLLCGVTLAAGVLVQPVTRRLQPTLAARLGLIGGAIGLALGAVAVKTSAPGALLVVASVLGAAYGTCMTAGLQAVQRIAPPASRGGLTGLYYVLTYVGFSAPYLLALAARAVAPELVLAITSGAALIVAAALGRLETASERVRG